MPLKGLSFEEIVKKEVAAGKSQKQAVAIAYSETGKNKKNDLSALERFDSLGMRTARGTERYASKSYNKDEASEDQDQRDEAELTLKKNK